MAKGKKTGGGSRKGIPNKITSSAKEAFAFAFDEIGGAAALALWAKNNQTDFYKLYAKLIPVETVNLTEQKTLKVEFVTPNEN